MSSRPSSDHGWRLWRVVNECSVRVRPVFAWFDFWVGIFIDRRTPAIYFLPLPMIGFKADWPGADPEIYGSAPTLEPKHGERLA